MKHLVAVLLAVILGLASFPVYGQDLEPPSSVDVDVETFERWTPRNLDEMRVIENAATQVTKDFRKAVVAIKVRHPRGWSAGSGTLISSQGLIVTAAHVVGAVDTKCLVYLEDGSCYEARSLGITRYFDLALVQITNEVSDLPFADLGYSSKVGVGQWVVSMGHPLGPMHEPLRPPVIRTSRVRSVSNRVIEVDGPFVPGDSGGPTFNLKGQLIGVNVSIIVGVPGRNNCAPINNLRYNMGRLLAGELITDTTSAWEREFGELLTSGYELLSKWQWAQSKEYFDKAIAMDGIRSEGYYHRACMYFRWFSAVGDRGSDPDELMDHGLSDFEKAVELGFSDLKHILGDPDVNVARSTPRFRSALRMMQRRMGFAAYLGVRLQESDAGLVVSKLIPGSPAQQVGIEVGDYLVRLGAEPLKDLKHLRNLVGQHRAGDKVLFEIRRDEEILHFSVLMAARGAIVDELPDTDLRSGSSILDTAKSSASLLHKAVVTFFVDGRQAGYGPIIRSDGYLLGKYSEIGYAEIELMVRLADGSEHEAKIVARDEETDIALVKIQAAELSVVAFSGDSDTDNGSFALAIGPGAAPLALGSISVKRFYDMPNDERAFFGVAGRAPPASMLTELELEGGVLVVGFEAASPAAAQGVRIGDLITEINGVAVTSMGDVLDWVRRSVPKESKLALTIYREGEKKELEVRVGAHTRGFGWGRSFQATRIRGPYNGRCSGFGEVIHHDLVLPPSAMGSLLVDLDGNILGLNIARYDRCKTIAIPAYRVRFVVGMLFDALEREGEPENEDIEDDEDIEEDF